MTNAKPIEHILLELDVKEFVEKKKDLSYLSWAHAWANALKHDPKANFTVHTFGDKPYMDVNGTAMVWVSVTMGGNTRTCWLPVMNASNAPISVAGRTFKDKYGTEKTEKLDSFNVNTAIMRCLTKCLGMFGLGLNVYAGEDLPLFEAEKEEVKQEEPKKEPKKEVKKEEFKKEEMSEQAKANMTLFAEALLTYLEIQRTVAALTSYWKANQGQIDDLKVKMPDLYEIVLEKFKAAKAEAKERESANA